MSHLMLYLMILQVPQLMLEGTLIELMTQDTDQSMSQQQAQQWHK